MILPETKVYSGGWNGNDRNHSIAVGSDGKAYTWGDNTVGQLGNGSTSIFSGRGVPTAVSGLNGVIAVGAGQQIYQMAPTAYSVALTSDGTVWEWGNAPLVISTTPAPVPGLPTNIVAISTHENFVMALATDGTVWTWGDNTYGQLGDGTTTARQTPVQVVGLTGVTAIAAGYDHALALRNDGTVWAWGRNVSGQLGDGSTTNHSVPAAIPSLNGIAGISAGNNYSLALKQDGTVCAWGSNFSGQLGDGTTTSRSAPVAVVGLTNVRTLVAGYGRSAAIKKDSTLWQWGNQQLTPTPTMWTGRTKTVALGGAGSSYTLALVVDPDPDLNRDDNHDLIWQNMQTGDATTWNLAGSQWFGASDTLGQGIPTDWKIVGTGDFNKDGSSDLIWQNTTTGDVTYWLMNGSVRIASDYIAHNLPLEWKIVGVADMDGDLNPDLIWQNTATGDVVVWYMNGATWTGNYDYIARAIPTEWEIVGTADMNGDAKPDLLWRNTQSGDLVVWYMDNASWAGNWNYVAQGIPLAWQLEAISDVSGDLMPDLIWRNTQTGDVVVWYLTGEPWTGNYDTIATGIPLEWQIARSH